MRIELGRAVGRHAGPAHEEPGDCGKRHEPLAFGAAARREPLVDDEPVGRGAQRDDALKARAAGHDVGRIVREVCADATRVLERARVVRPVERTGRIEMRVLRDAVGGRGRRLYQDVVTQPARRVEDVRQHAERAKRRLIRTERHDARAGVRHRDRDEAIILQHDLARAVLEHVGAIRVRSGPYGEVEVRRPKSLRR
ncbi:MAG TPA: hypothetical protein VGU66_19705 [Candidatus Elarobacter sp.]|nr:hypothetical protein [Candidatus Elarobacter sp.]